MPVFWQLLKDDRPAKDGSAGLAARLPVPSSSSDRRALSHSLTSADELRRHGFLFCVREVLPQSSHCHPDLLSPQTAIQAIN